MANYSLIGSYATVQSLTSTQTRPIQYTTIQTQPSGVVAAYPVSKVDFDAGLAYQVLTNFASGIEYIMALPHVIAGVGSSSLDENGLLADLVIFTVQYTGPNADPSGVTNTADVPVAELDAIPQQLERGEAITAEDYITNAYNALVAAAGG